MRFFPPVLFLSLGASAFSADFYTSKQIQASGDKLLQKGAPFASDELGRYKEHYTLLAARNETGSAEVHEHEADYFIIEKGGGTLISGGKVVNPKVQKAGEIRGTSIEGGSRREIGAGDVIHIPAGEPHELLITKGNPIVYFVVKVQGQ